MWRRPLAVALVVIGLNAALWTLVNRGVFERPWGGRLGGLSYSGYQIGDASARLSDETIERDVTFLASRTASLRTYGLADGLDRIIAAAARHGLSVVTGAWIGPDERFNNEELDRLIDATRMFPAITRAIVGNESALRGDVTVDQLIGLLDRARRQIRVPVSTAEPWHVWMDHPELANAVDFITVHILPYWEGIPENKALDYVIYRYNQLQKAFPGKHIMIGEVGWPSEGQWVKAAEPSQINQARFIRGFLNWASEHHIDASIIEAFDAPWKRKIEGTVGAHWGLWTPDYTAKFPMSGPVFESRDWMQGCAVASLLALIPLLIFARRRSDLPFRGQLFYAALVQAVADLLVGTLLAAMAEQIIRPTTLAWIVLIGTQLVLLALLLVDGFELTEVLWARRQRAFEPLNEPLPPNPPKVSIHVPCYNEPPEMVIATLDALAQLDYPAFEVLVVDNNTKDEAVWKPLEAHCARLGPRFRFFHLPSWPGYKAGALNFALAETATDAAFIGVIDSDYQVIPSWLRATVPYFDRPAVAFVQAPQDYRDGNASLFKRMAYWEYAGFFHIGMVQRNERNAIIQHGTMTLIRKSALRQTGGWAEWCICEDAELGLRLFEHGYESVYLPHSMGRGLIPDTFADYKTQRFRWAYGAVQILKHHGRSLGRGDTLTRGQKYHFVSGWLPWFADAAHLVFALAALVWSGLLLVKWVEFPPAVFLVPTLSVFVFKILAGLWLYRARVRCGARDRVGAALAGMALTHAVGRAVWQGLVTSGKPFFRTPKCENKPAILQGLLMAREEIGLLLFLWISAGAVLGRFEVSNKNACLWAGMLVVQSLPYLAALFVAMANALPGRRRAQ